MPGSLIARNTHCLFCGAEKRSILVRYSRPATTYPLALGGAGIEVTLDRGEIFTGDRSKPLCEIEIESKAGDRAALFRLAGTIAGATSAELTIKSKAQRG
jgi:hypothetical protein